MKVSIIIPVYNVALYVEQCIQSVMNQTMTKDVECIIVDDCGQDNSMEIVERLIASYDGGMNFCVLHHNQNRGLSAARNTGIVEAKGEWIFLLDSDDSISANCIELMLDSATREDGVDMVVGEINVIGGNPQWNEFLNPGVYTEGFIEKACSYQIYTMAWNRLISKKFLIGNKLLFEEGLLHEDVLWNVQSACKVKKIVWLEYKTYNYRIRKCSIQTNESMEFHKRHLGNVKLKLLEFIFNNSLEANRALYRYIVHDINDYIMFAGFRCQSKLIKDFYNGFKSTPYWSISHIRSFDVGLRDKILYYCRKMPGLLGLYLYKTFMWSIYRLHF